MVQLSQNAFGYRQPRKGVHGRMESDEAVYLRYLAQGSDADLETLLARHRDALYLFLLSFVRSPEDAEDLLIDTFARLAVEKPGFVPSPRSSFRSWLYTIARNSALMQIRKGNMQTVEPEEDLPSALGIPETELLKEERNRTLYRAIASLKPEYRRVLTLLYLDGLSHKEIAETMGMRLRQIYNLAERGKTSLRKKLEEMGVHDAT